MCGGHRSHEHERAEVTPRERPAGPLRASDAERDAVVEELREHAGAGRLGMEELDGRIAAALAATTRDDLAALLADLPSAPRRRDPALARRELHEHLRTYLAVMALLVVIWALTGADYFWPIWPMLGWGIGIASHAREVRGGARRRALPA